MGFIRGKKAFTLIELLVVIAIIALLLSIIMPSLQKVKRQARLVICSTNLHSYAMGLTIAAESNNGKYIRRINNPLPSLLYRIDIAGATDEEYLLLVDSLYSAFSGVSGFDCPFAPESLLPTGEPGYFDPGFGTNPPGPVKYGLVWWVRSPYGWYYSQTYNIFAGLDYPTHLDWSHSGNGNGPKQHPTLAGSSREVVVADRVDYYNRDDPATSRWYALHNKKGNQWGNFIEQPPLDAPYPEEFEDSQKGYGDCHVERTQKKESLHWVEYYDGYNYFLY